MAKKYPDEEVLVVPRSLFDEVGSFQGLNFEAEDYLKRFLEPGNHQFLARDDAEEDPSYKQLIPYAIFSHYSEEGEHFLQYVRGGGGGEKRLTSKRSMGIGGHINREDFLAGDAEIESLNWEAYMRGVARETEEELRIESPYTQRIVALLNDDSNPVGEVHLGVVHLFQMEGDQVFSNEDVITELSFFTREELSAERESLEGWSQICFDNIDKLTGTAQAA